MGDSESGGTRCIERLHYGVAISRRDDARRVHRTDQYPTDFGQPFCGHVSAQSRFDFLDGAGPEIERCQLDRARPDPLGDLLAGNDQILAAIVYGAHHDVGVRVACIESRFSRLGADLRHRVCLIRFPCKSSS
ncbi:hypothetical protein ACFSCW_06530 [Sphingomonas tabacisoli]|uniref:Uncharacterized protein n=1 Tax=Sphingomonas tabacisoli TaxID=2249466 RepID=A0ABW4I1F3_9SPHN